MTGWRPVGILAVALVALGACAAGTGAPARPAAELSPCVDPFSGYVARDCR
jgi:hypothetical protein